ILDAIENSPTGGNVNISQIDGNTPDLGSGVVGAGTLRVELPTDGTGKVGLNAGSEIIGGTYPVPNQTNFNALTNKDSVAYEASNIIKAAAGRAYVIEGYNSGPAQWIQIHNVTTLVANGAVPVLIKKVPTDSNFEFDLGVYGRYFSTGIMVCNSTTGPTKTIGA